jgi:signal transduction histidine kinase
MRRLYLQIYLSFLGILLLFGLLASITWVVTRDGDTEKQIYKGVSTIASELLNGPDASPRELQQALKRIGGQFPLQLTLRSSSGELLASFLDPLPAPEPGRKESGWMPSRGKGPTWAILLTDGRWLIIRSHRAHHKALGFLATLVLLTMTIAIGAYPLARRITRRLENLQNRVDQLGTGDLSIRVNVEGKDEIARLADSFNQAAEKIQGLMNTQRTMLAAASHELRTPLTRIRMAIELLTEESRPELRKRIEKDISELDDLIEELLLASRLQTLTAPVKGKEVDLLALVAEEAARAKANVVGESVSIKGDPRLLRRLIRNLLVNAHRYGGNTEIEATVTASTDIAILRICDRGPGIPEEERERIFEPFYRPAGTSETGKGVGLGLALVRQIARQHGGEVHYLARDGGGACFEVTFTSMKSGAYT